MKNNKTTYHEICQQEKRLKESISNGEKFEVTSLFKTFIHDLDPDEISTPVATFINEIDSVISQNCIDLEQLLENYLDEFYLYICDKIFVEWWQNDHLALKSFCYDTIQVLYVDYKPIFLAEIRELILEITKNKVLKS